MRTDINLKGDDPQSSVIERAYLALERQGFVGVSDEQLVHPDGRVARVCRVDQFLNRHTLHGDALVQIYS